MLCLYQENVFFFNQSFWKEIGPAPLVFNLKREIVNFTVGQNLNLLKLTFYQEKTQYWSKSYQKKQNSNILEGMFSIFLDVANILGEVQDLKFLRLQRASL